MAGRQRESKTPRGVRCTCVCVCCVLCACTALFSSSSSFPPDVCTSASMVNRRSLGNKVARDHYPLYRGPTTTMSGINASARRRRRLLWKPRARRVVLINYIFARVTPFIAVLPWVPLCSESVGTTFARRDLAGGLSRTLPRGECSLIRPVLGYFASFPFCFFTVVVCEL